MAYHINEELSDVIFEVNGDKIAFKVPIPSSGIGADEMWNLLDKEGSNQIHLSHIKNALDLYFKNGSFDSYFEEDEYGNIRVKGGKNFYTEGEISAGGYSEGGDTEPGGCGSIDETKLWEILGKEGTQQIDSSHLQEAFKEFTPDLSGYVTSEALSTILQNYVTSDTLNAHTSDTNLHLSEEDREKLSWFAKDEQGNIYIKGGLNFYTEGEISAGGYLDEGGTEPGGGAGIDETQLWQILGDSGTEQVAKNHLTTALSDYITTSSANSLFATKTELSNYATSSALAQTNSNVTAISAKLDDFLEGSDTDTIINKWKELEAFLSGMSESDNLADILSNKTDKAWTEEQLGYKLDKSVFDDLFEKVLISEGKYAIKAKYDFYSEGEISAGGYSDEGGSAGGGSIFGIKVNGSTYEPVDGYITIPDYPTELAWGAITGKPTTIAGYGITDAVTLTTEQSISGQKTFQKVIYQGANLSNRRAISFVDTSNNAIFADVNGSTILRGSNIRFQLVNGTDLVKISGSDVLINGNTSYHTGNLSWSNLQGKPSTWSWNNITDKPSTYTPSSHTHTKSQITDFPTTWSWSNITGKPTTLSGYGVTDGVNSVSVTGSGNAITNASIAGHTLTLTKGSTYLLSSEYTASDILTKLKTVDGAGSGLDADTIDGTDKSGLFTGISSSAGINLVITIGGTTKSIYDLYADRAERLNERWIWGQPFDGTNDVDGSMFVNGNIFLYGDYMFLRYSQSVSYGIYFSPKSDGSFWINGHENNTYTKAFMVFDYESGNVGVGTSSPEYKLHVNGNARINDSISVGGYIAVNSYISVTGYITSSSYLQVTGNITCKSDIIATGEISAGSTSDLRLKNLLPTADYRKRLLDLGMVVDYTYNDLAFTRNVRSAERRRYTGLIYQDVKKVMPQMAGEDADGYGYLNYIHTDYINLIAGALQQTILKQETIEQRVERLERENKELKEQLNSLRA